ncbi:MAG: AzlD domain-containing protein [Conchiformibius sp.]|nr:AzlD domain-containing protein [Conchiformibius sp.]
MISWTSFLTILGMLAVTYASRLIGYFALRGRTLSPRSARILEAAPGCVLAAVIAPYFVSPHAHERIAAVVALCVSVRLGMAGTVAAAVATAGVLAAFGV